eukprot:gene32376-2564_t
MRLQAAAGFLVVLEVLLVFEFGTSSSVASNPLDPLKASDPGAAGLLRRTLAEVPNIVHFVSLSPDGSQPRQYSFLSWLSVYSAYHHLHPHRIMVHTNARAEESKWSKAMADIPGLEFVNVVPPQAAGGKTITHLAHQSDFVRVEALLTHGGVYLDFDAFPIRDMSPLRHLLFGVVVGNQAINFGKKPTGICNAVILAEPNSSVLQSIHKGMHARFDPNKWVTNLEVLAGVVQERHNEVIVLPHHAFHPFDWTKEGHQELFINSEPWDWRYTYTIHGFFSQLRGREHTEEGQYIKKYLDDPGTVFRGSSRFSQAVHSAMQGALEAGHLQKSDLVHSNDAL